MRQCNIRSVISATTETESVLKFLVFGIFKIRPLPGPCQAAGGPPRATDSQTWTDTERTFLPWPSEANSMTATTRCTQPMPACLPTA